MAERLARRGDRIAAAALLAPPVAWLAVFFAVPLTAIWLYSFGRTLGVDAIAVTGTLQNYARALDPLYLGIDLKSAAISALATGLCLVVGAPVAFAIAMAPARLKLPLLMAVMLPFWINGLIRTFALASVLRDHGHLNALLGWLADAAGWTFEPLPLLHNNAAVLAGLVYTNLPFMVLPLYAAIDRIDRSLLEASLDLGAGRLRTIGEVVVPLARPGILSGVFLTFIPTLGAYLVPDLLGGADNQMIATVIGSQFKRANDWPFGAALSFVLLYATIAVLIARAWVARRAAAS